jgi:hypothetical protein
MQLELSDFSARLGAEISRLPPGMDSRQFSQWALELFALQYAGNPAYRQICDARGRTSADVTSWEEIPAVPTGVFKALELTCLAPAERTREFYSSGTTGQKNSRNFHGRESLELYEQSLWRWFELHFAGTADFLFLTPDHLAAPNSSLVHMFETVRRKHGLPMAAFTGQVDGAGVWTVDFSASRKFLAEACASGRPITLLGTAFSFVHLLDYLAERDCRLPLPTGSRVMETGGYKNRSRVLPKAELHGLITTWLGVARENIICEYGMSELSSQAYDSAAGFVGGERSFRFPPWARVQIISPESGAEVGEGETGLIRIIDLANVFSVMAIQTEDLGVRRADGFELVGRAQPAELRGCSLMMA